MTLTRKILFTAVFTVYWFIFYAGAYYALAWWDPTLLEVPEDLSQVHVLGAMGLFTLLVFLAYAGAGYVVLGRLPGSDRDADFGGRRTHSDRGRRGEPAAADRLRKSRRLFGGGRATDSATAGAAPARTRRDGGRSAKPGAKRDARQPGNNATPRPGGRRAPADNRRRGPGAAR